MNGEHMIIALIWFVGATVVLWMGLRQDPWDDGHTARSVIFALVWPLSIPMAMIALLVAAWVRGVLWLARAMASRRNDP